MTFQEICESKYGKKIVEEIPLTAEFKQIDIRKETQTLKDGTVLVSYISFPVGDYKALPVIFLRTPYGVESLRFFHEMSFWGYICVAQCCRGTGGSSGIWEPAKNEIADGLEALGWLIKQPWCNGKIAMTGSSYLSMNQWVLADKLPKEVKTLNIEAYSPYRHELLYTDKMFHLEAYAGWTAYNHGVKNPICPQEKLYGEILKFKPQIKMDETLLGKPLKWYRKWLLGTNAKEEINHTGDWKCLEKMPKALSVPTLFFGGYHDPHFEGMVKAWGNIAEETKKNSLMIFAPVNHKQAVCGDLTVENINEFTGTRFVKMKLLWFDHFLKGNKLMLPTGEIKAFVYGENKWVTPKKNPTKHKLFLNTTKRTLTKEPPNNTESICYTYDPKDPVPTLGSDDIMTDYMYHKNKKTVEGIRLQPQSNWRKDVISFESNPLTEDLYIESHIVLKLMVESSAPDTSFTGKVIVVTPSGERLSIRSGITTILASQDVYQPNTAVEVTISMPLIFMNIQKGSQLRVDVSSSDYPAYHAHPNTLNNWAVEESHQLAQQKIIGGCLFF